MVRSFSAAWLLVALAALLPLRASAQAPLRLPDLLLQLGPAKAASPQQANGAFILPPQRIAARQATWLEAAEEPEPVAPRPTPEALPPIEGAPLTQSWPGPAPASDAAVIAAPPELTWYDCVMRACVAHRDPNDPQRHLGLGEPLTNTSWRNRPMYVDFFAGGLIGDELQEGVVSQGGGFFAGGRFGGDFDHYWGVETRLAFSDVNTNFSAGGYGQSRDSFFDASLLYYPWGDSRWRPYLSLGLGVANYRYQTFDGTRISAGAMELPWGGGMKFLLRPDVALRFDLIDNLSFPSGSRSDAMHNISFTGGIELRFGGRRTSYGSW
jgi:outer membrane protein with beta-barrel domain